MEQRRNLVEPVLMLGSLACALIGQRFLSRPEASFLGSLPWFLAAGTSLSVLIARKERPELWLRLTRAWSSLPYLRFIFISFLLSMTCLSLIVYREDTGSNFYWDAFGLWLASWALYLFAFQPPSLAWWRERWQAHRREVLLVLGLMGVAAVLRFLWLSHLPEVLSGDEGLHSQDARHILEGAFTHPFATFYGSGSLYLFAVALVLKVLGYTVLATRIIPAIGGVLGVPATYLLARRLFGSPTAFVAAGLVTALHSHVHFSRVLGVGYINATLFASLGVYLLYSALENHSLRRAALGGVVMGLWLYVYVDSRFVPVVLLTWGLVLLALPRQRALILDNLKPLAAFVGGYVIAAAPMALWALRHWSDFNQRFGQNGVFEQHYYAGRENLLQFIFEQWSHAFLSITHYQMGFFYDADVPLLDVLTASVFWIALLYSLLRLRDRRYLLLNIWFWSGVTTVGLLTLPRDSDGYRLLIVFIPLVIMIGITAEQLAQGLSSVWQRHPGVTWGALSIFLTAVLVINTQLYFVKFARGCTYLRGDSTLAGRMSYYLGEILAGMRPGDKATYLGKEDGGVVYRYGTHASAEFLNPGVEVQSLITPLTPEFLTQPAPRAFILIPERLADLTALQAAYPGGQVREIDDCGIHGPILYVYSLY